jgi:hypothetical protein
VRKLFYYEVLLANQHLVSRRGRWRVCHVQLPRKSLRFRRAKIADFQDALFNSPSCDSDHAMPRRPLAEITGNRASNCELSSYQRAKIDRSRELGQRPQLIAETLNLPPSTVYYTLDKIDARNQGHSLLRSGRPLKWTEHDKRRIVRFVQINP